MRGFIAVSVCALALAFAGCYSHQQQPVGAGPAPMYAGQGAGWTGANVQPGQQPAQQVLSRLHRFNQIGIEIGQLAQTNAASPEVKQLASDIARTRMDLDNKVQQIARRDNITLVEPTPVDTTDREYMSYQNRILQELRTLKGPAFDRAYLTTMVLHHADLLPILRDAAPEIADQEMKSLVMNAIPQLDSEYQRGLGLLARSYQTGEIGME